MAKTKKRKWKHQQHQQDQELLKKRSLLADKSIYEHLAVEEEEEDKTEQIHDSPETDEMSGREDRMSLVSDEDLRVTLRTLGVIGQHLDLLRDKRMKPLRSALHPIVEERIRQTAGNKLLHAASGGGSLSGKISEALKDQRWDDAIELLHAMRAPREIPKLGAVQRWVRDCDLGATAANDPQALRVLDAILRAAGQDWFGLAASAAASARQEGQDGEPELVKGSGMVRRFPAWCPVPKQEGRSYEPDKFFDVDKSSLRIIGHEKADERRPPNKHDLHIWYAPPSVLRFEQDRPPTIRFDFPSVPGAFFLSSVLSPQECWQIISVAEAMGFSPDEPLDKAVDSRADGCVWLVDDEIQRKVLDRIEHLMPPVLGGGKFAGLNARWRLYRYTTGNVYRPHVDGAWPGSGVDEEGNYVYDKTGDRWSRLTFVIYLTEDFEGGCTTFFTPARIEGCLELRGVEPRQGSVLCFPHGDTAESLVHEGSEVFRGVKYIVRTDALYMLPESQQSGVEKLYKRHMKVNSSDRWTVNK